MRCLLCEKFSFRFICKSCTPLISAYPQKHLIRGKLTVFSFFDFDTADELIRSKYLPFGSQILALLATLSFKPFFRDLPLADTAIIPIDDRVGKHFSHTAVLAKTAQNYLIRARFGTLRATSLAHYAGKTLAFRKANPRNFAFKNFKESNAILLDDLMTTGTTLQEASDKLEAMGKTVLFAVVLAKAK